MLRDVYILRRIIAPFMLSCILLLAPASIVLATSGFQGTLRLDTPSIIWRWVTPLPMVSSLMVITPMGMLMTSGSG